MENIGVDTVFLEIRGAIFFCVENNQTSEKQGINIKEWTKNNLGECHPLKFTCKMHGKEGNGVVSLA